MNKYFIPNSVERIYIIHYDNTRKYLKVIFMIIRAIVFLEILSKECVVLMFYDKVHWVIVNDYEIIIHLNDCVE